MPIAELPVEETQTTQTVELPKVEFDPTIEQYKPVQD